MSTTMPLAPADDARGVRTAYLTVRADSAQLAGLVARVDAGEPDVHVTIRQPLVEAALVHEQSDTGTLPGRVVVVPALDTVPSKVPPPAS